MKGYFSSRYDCTVSKQSLMSGFMNPGEANQISCFRLENLLWDCRPEAKEKSSPVSGIYLLKTLMDLSPSSYLCQDDMLSFQASRWLFVYDDLLIFFSSTLVWLFSLPLVAVGLPSSEPGEMMVQTAAAHKEVKWEEKKLDVYIGCSTHDLLLNLMQRNCLKNIIFPLLHIYWGHPSTWPW